MNIGSLDRLVDLQEPVYTTNAMNEKDTSFQKIASVWARKIDKQGGESGQANRETPINNTQFIIRYRSDVDHTHRVSYDSKIYNIVGIEEIGRKSGLRLITKQLN